MNYKWLFVVFTLLFLQCKKGENYCELPDELKGVKPFPAINNPAKPVKISLNFQEVFSDQHKNTLYSFSIPSVFINPKGANRPIDVVKIPEYEYMLKDTANPPYSVEIEAHVFNDCGKSNTIKQTIIFDTIP